MEPSDFDKQKSTVYWCDAEPLEKNLPFLLESSGISECAAQKQVLIKPNLVEILAPPITTPVRLVEQIVIYLLNFLPDNRIFIGEGCGSTEYDTHRAFHELGYTRLAERYNVELVDLNSESLILRKNNDCQRWPEMYLPELLDHVFLLSVPQLKAHSLSKVTLSMKNMMGCVPPSHYKGGGAWNKSAFHDRIHEAVYDLNRYRAPDFTLLDAAIGMAKAHLWGPQCSPPVAKLAASSDPVAIDSYGASLLGKSWRDVDHIVMADGKLGNAEDYDLKKVD